MTGPISGGTPAIHRYDGTFIRLLRKYIEEGLVDERDVLIVSPTLGLVRALDSIPHHEPTLGGWQSPRLDENKLRVLNRRALELFKEIARTGNYEEVFINVGKKLYPIIEGCEKLLACKIVHATGRGIGPKAAHMKSWILSKATV